MKNLLVLFLVGCGGDPVCYHNNYQTLKRYPVNFTQMTSMGIGVDSTGQKVDLAIIDRLTSQLDICLEKSFKANPTITSELAKKADCRTDVGVPRVRFDNIYIKTCFKVKVPNDWEYSKCYPEEQLLPISAPDALCEAKGLHPTPECPCRWRVETQDDYIIVSPPNLKLFKAELARMVTGCNNVWIVPQIIACLP